MAKKPAEEPKPEVKTQPEEAKPEVKINKSAEVTKALKALGAEATYAEVQQYLTDRGINIKFPSSLVSVLKKKEFGASAVRVRGGSSSSTTHSGEATISDLKRAQQFATSLKMKPHELLQLVAQINSFGDLETLETCLKTLEELTG